jgi:hypothetical protein
MGASPPVVSSEVLFFSMNSSTGSFSLKLFILLIAGTILAFAGATGRWLFIIYLKIGGE